MSRRQLFFPVGSILVFGLTAGCLDQFYQTENNKKYKAEREASVQPVAKLTDKGELPSGNKEISVDERFATLCSPCHGAQGGGDGPAGLALNPKPRNFHDKQWQAKATEESIAKVIKSGGASIGLSPMMAPWGGVLSDAEIKNMVVKIRAFGT